MGRVILPLALIWACAASLFGAAFLYYGQEPFRDPIVARAPSSPEASTPETEKGEEVVLGRITADQTITRYSIREMRTNQAALVLIKDSEQLRLSSYQGLKGQWLIGYGHAGNVSAGMRITPEEAENLLKLDLKTSEDYLKDNITVPLTENEFSALVSLTYNIGTGNMASSSVLRDLNAGDYLSAADNILLWNKSGGKAYTHLSQRRQQERELFLTPDDTSPDTPQS